MTFFKEVLNQKVLTSFYVPFLLIKRKINENWAADEVGVLYNVTNCCTSFPHLVEIKQSLYICHNSLNL